MSLDDLQSILGDDVRWTPLKILVWGPGSAAGPDYEKRLKIQAELRAAFPRVTVCFSEEVPPDALPAGAEGLDTVEQELWHLAWCDLCVVLDTAKGAGEEIAHFSGTTQRHKLLVLTHQRYQGAQTFPGAIRRRLLQEFYSDDDYTSCNLVNRVLARAHYLALRKRMFSG